MLQLFSDDAAQLVISGHTKQSADQTHFGSNNTTPTSPSPNHQSSTSQLTPRNETVPLSKQTISGYSLGKMSNATVIKNETSAMVDNDNNDWLEMPKIDSIGDVLSIGCSAAMIFGGLVPFIPQYLKIKRSMNSDGFSTYGNYQRQKFANQYNHIIC